MEVKLTRVDLFQSETDHVFNFVLSRQGVGTFVLPIVTRNVTTSLDKQWVRAHENLIFTLEAALAAAKAELAFQREARGVPEQSPASEPLPAE